MKFKYLCLLAVTAAAAVTRPTVFQGGETPGTSSKALDKVSIEGDWAELSRYQDGETTVEMELDPRTNTFIPVEAYWHFSKKTSTEGTRRVLRSETNDAPDDLYLGAYRIHRNRDPWTIEFQSGKTGIIKLVSEDLAVIGLAEGAGDVPIRFRLGRGKIRSLIAEDAVGKSKRISVFTLRRVKRKASRIQGVPSDGTGESNE